MTQETKEALAGILPMRNDAVYEFVPHEFDHVAEEYRPVFFIRQFSEEQVLEIKDILYKEVTGKKKPTMKDINTRNVECMALLHSVFAGWDNLIDVSSGELYPEYNGSIENLMELPEVIRTTLFSEAMKITGFVPVGK